MAKELNKEQTLAMVSDKDLRKYISDMMDRGWVAAKSGQNARIRFTHPDHTECGPVFLSNNTDAPHTIRNFKARVERSERDPEYNEEMQATVTGLMNGTHVIADHEGKAIPIPAGGISKAWCELPVHSTHTHSADMSTAKLVKHLERAHKFREFTGMPIDDRAKDRDVLVGTHDYLHDGLAVPPRELLRTMDEGRAEPDGNPAELSEMSDISNENAGSPDENDTVSDENVIDLTGDKMRKGSIQRTVLAVMHEFPGVAMTVEEATDLCPSEYGLSQDQVGQAMWRLSRNEDHRIYRTSAGVYVYRPPQSADKAVIDRSRPLTPAPPAAPRPDNMAADLVTDPQAEPQRPAAVMRPTATPPAHRPAPRFTAPPDAPVFEFVMRAEDGSYILRHEDGSVWVAKPI